MSAQTFRESFLLYVWQYQYFSKNELNTTSGESIQVLSPGITNRDSGPDFYNCRLLINQIEWFGTVEIHYKTSDWNKHKHSSNKAYNSVILHLVWEEDVKIEREDKSVIPTLELKQRVGKEVIELYQNLLNNPYSVPCQSFINKIDSFFIDSMLEKAQIERLQNKSLEIIQILNSTSNNWEETCYRWIGKCFGFKINSEAFLQLCNIVSISILKKYYKQPLKVDALLFGAAGFLENIEYSTYSESLKNEYAFLKLKHSIEKEVNLTSWKFLRLRPPNFPTLRIAQFSAFIVNHSSLADILLYSTIENIREAFALDLPEFWNNHYHFNKEAAGKHDPGLGAESIDNLIINTILPLRFTLGLKKGDEVLMNETLELFRKIRPEKNHITNIYEGLGLRINTAFESQAFIQLYNGYCQKKQCLNCIIGHQIINPVAANGY